jgi:FKBP-type peptidyl-prolyl cis-trans isomerase
VATTKSQRISIWIIAIILTLGTGLSFFAIILNNKNASTQQAEVAKYQADVAAQTKELSDKYYPTLNSYSSKVGPYTIDGVTDVASTDLVVGTGADINEDTSYAAYYIGWLPDGTIFDSSISNGALAAPFSVTPGGVISGWAKGTTGMKVGGIREITMTAAEGYGDQAQGKVPANSPLRFIVMTIPTPATVPMSQTVLNYYKSLGY